MAVVRSLKDKVNVFFDRIIARWSNWLPLKGKLLNVARQLCLDNLSKVGVVFEQLFSSGDYEHGVDWLIMLLKGNVKLTGVPSFLVDWALGLLSGWLKANKDLFRDQIGHAPPVIS